VAALVAISGRVVELEQMVVEEGTVVLMQAARALMVIAVELL
jgi:hypothetical protein